MCHQEFMGKGIEQNTDKQDLTEKHAFLREFLILFLWPWEPSTRWLVLIGLLLWSDEFLREQKKCQDRDHPQVNVDVSVILLSPAHYTTVRSNTAEWTCLVSLQSCVAHSYSVYTRKWGEKTSSSVSSTPIFCLALSVRLLIVVPCDTTPPCSHTHTRFPLRGVFSNSSPQLFDLKQRRMCARYVRRRWWRLTSVRVGQHSLEVHLSNRFVFEGARFIGVFCRSTDFLFLTPHLVYRSLTNSTPSQSWHSLDWLLFHRFHLCLYCLWLVLSFSLQLLNALHTQTWIHAAAQSVPLTTYLANGTIQQEPALALPTPLLTVVATQPKKNVWWALALGLTCCALGTILIVDVLVPQLACQTLAAQVISPVMSYVISCRVVSLHVISWVLWVLSTSIFVLPYLFCL